MEDDREGKDNLLPQPFGLKLFDIVDDKDNVDICHRVRNVILT
jgi:hypothetical protein